MKRKETEVLSDGANVVHEAEMVPLSSWPGLQVPVRAGKGVRLRGILAKRMSAQSQ